MLLISTHNNSHQKHLSEALLICTQNLCFYREMIKKYLPDRVSYLKLWQGSFSCAKLPFRTLSRQEIRNPFQCRSLNNYWRRSVLIEWKCCFVVFFFCFFFFCYFFFFFTLTHISLVSQKRDIGKQCRQEQTPQNAASNQGQHCLH